MKLLIAFVLLCAALSAGACGPPSTVLVASWTAADGTVVVVETPVYGENLEAAIRQHADEVNREMWEHPPKK